MTGLIFLSCLECLSVTIFTHMQTKNPPFKKTSAERLIIAKEVIRRAIEKKVKYRADLDSVLRSIARKDGSAIFRNDELVFAYKELIKDGKIKKNNDLEKLMRKRSVRSESGVSVIAVLTKPLSCPGKCIYCPTPAEMPKSYLPNEPAVLRAARANFEPKKQVVSRIEALEASGHDVSKIEIIVMGGTWSAHSHQYQSAYIKSCFAALNGSKKTETLEEEQKKNESAKYRCVGLTLETRPDYIDEKELLRMREFGCTRVEIGVQSLYDDVHKVCQRGHGTKEIKEATRLLRQFGFKIVYHMMLNLPGSTPKKDIKMFKELFSSPDYCPDQIKIYPCVLTADAELSKWYKKGKWKPYSDTVLTNTIAEIKKDIPEWCRVIRVIRDIPSDDIIAGSKISNLRQILQNKGVVCRCIRCREIRDLEIKKTELVRREYEVAEGKEVFLSYEDTSQDKLIGLCRLFLPSDNIAMIRELHVYGTQTPVGDKGKKSQHKGLGGKLLSEAERIAKKEGYQKMKIISGVGVRDYYRKKGYRLVDTYMVKKIS